jgi:hypothetical protein
MNVYALQTCLVVWDLSPRISLQLCRIQMVSLSTRPSRAFGCWVAPLFSYTGLFLPFAVALLGYGFVAFGSV